MMRRLRSMTLKILLLIGIFIISTDWATQSVTAADTAKSMAELQKNIYSALLDRNTSMQYTYTGSLNKKNFETALNEAIESDPYTQLIVKQYAYKYQGSLLSTHIQIQVEYLETEQESAAVKKKLKEVIKQIIKPGMNDHQKVKAIHDWVVLQLAYDADLKLVTAYEGLTYHKTVCQGYALITYQMLKEAGISNLIAEGTAGGQLHAWNLVQLDGKWYHLDTTWDDPVPDIKGKVSYAYYLRTDAQMKQDHIWTKSYPHATTDYYATLQSLMKQDAGRKNFYNQLEVELEYIYLKPDNVVSTVDGLAQKLKDAVKTKTKMIKIRYTRKDTLRSDLTKAMAKVPELNGSISYTYRDFGKKGDILLEITFK